MSLHTEDQACPECEKKLLTAHPYMVTWFHKRKSENPDLHVAWAYRDKAQQEACIISGATKVEYPNSKHNRTRPDGTPCSLALDIFQIGKDKVARWSSEFYRKLHMANIAEGDLIVWGGTFHDRFDGPHFECADLPVVEK